MSLLAAILIIVPLAQAEVNIGEIDSYSKTSAGQALEYNWTLYNPDNRTYHIEVLCDVPSGWSARVSDASFDLEKGGYRTFTLKLVPGEYAESGNFTVSFREIPYSEPNASIERTFRGSAEISTETPRTLTLFEEFLHDRLGIYIENRVLAFIVNILFWTGIGVLLFLLIDPAMKRAAKRTKTDVDDMILEIIKGPVAAFLVLYGAASSVYIFAPPKSIAIFVTKIYDISVIILVSWVVYKIFRDIVIIKVRKYAGKTKTQLDDALIPLAEKLGIITIILAAGTAIMGYLGIDITMLIAGMGVIGLIIAFAAQDTLSNFFSGIHLLIDRPFREGDIIKLETGEYCEVKHVGMRSTKLYNTFDHDMIIVPNNDLAGQKIVNISTPDANFKVRFPMDVSYDSDVDEVKRTILEVAMEHPNVIKEGDKAPFVRLVDFLDSNIRFQLYLWVDDAMNQWKVESEIKEELFKRFNQKGIEISYPINIIHLEKD